MTIAIQTAAVTAQTSVAGLTPLAMTLLLFPLLGSKKMRQKGRAMVGWFSMLVLTGGIGALTALSGRGGHFFSQATKDYSLNAQ